MSENNTFDPESFAQEQSKIHQRQIDDFCRRRNQQAVYYEGGEGKILLIGDQEFGGIEERLKRILLDTQARIKKGAILNNCYGIASMVVHTRIADGAIHTEEGASDFVGWGNHCINYMKLPDGSILAVDFTAEKNIDYGRGNFHVLAIQAPSRESLIEKLNDLYGGNWSVLSDEEIKCTYKLNYPDNKQDYQTAFKRLEELLRSENVS